MDELRLLLVRHGQSTANRDRLVLGRSLNVPLTEIGREQAEQAARRVDELVGDKAATVISSDALRARQTATIVAARLGVGLEVSELLREQYLGDLEGRPVDQLRPLPVPAGVDITEVAWGGGESIAEVHQRMRRLLYWLHTRAELAEVVVLVGHGDAFCVLRAVLAGRGHREIDWTTDALGLGEVADPGLG